MIFFYNIFILSSMLRFIHFISFVCLFVSGCVCVCVCPRWRSPFFVFSSFSVSCYKVFPEYRFRFVCYAAAFFQSNIRVVCCWPYRVPLCRPTLVPTTIAVLDLFCSVLVHISHRFCKQISGLHTHIALFLSLYVVAGVTSYMDYVLFSSCQGLLFYINDEEAQSHFYFDFAKVFLSTSRTNYYIVYTYNGMNSMHTAFV